MKNLLPSLLLASLSLSLSLSAFAQSETIRVNQVGFHPQGEKTATIEVASADEAPVTATLTDKKGKTLWTGKAVRTAKSPFSDKVRQIINFSAFQKEGRFTLSVNNDKTEITISRQPLRSLSAAAIKAFYYQRASMPIEKKYAGRWSRVGGHPDNQVLVHPSAATPERPAGTTLSSPGGWYDAGDYNKYIVNSGYTIGVMLNAYERNKDYYQSLRLNIPESKNGVPDLLDEIHYNLAWMLTMQDTDGGVYHKLTAPDFEAFIAPDECRQPRYVVRKGTAATLDFAATMAMAARIYKEYARAYPGFAETALQQAKRAYAWAKEHPNIPFNQGGLNREFDPDISTGTYDDFRFTDEFFWAASELYFTTDEQTYRDDALVNKPRDYATASWGNVAELGALDWINFKSGDALANEFRDKLLALLRPYVESAATSCFVSPAGNSMGDFGWGCLGERFAWRGVQMLYAYQLTGDDTYRLNARRCLNYILGQNATGYCYVTGFGTNPTSHPHHRLAQTPQGALPGFLAGGPNPQQNDREHVTYHTRIADESYEDITDSYASNEIAINWNAALVALTGWLDALEK